MARRTLTLEQFQNLCRLCDRHLNKFVQKEGQDYVTVLGQVFELVNQNDNPLCIEDILQTHTLDEFEFEGKNDFQFICFLHVQPMTITFDHLKENEKIFPTNFASKDAEDIFKNRLGVAYMITCPYEGKEYIIKFGQTRTTFKDRLGSYNCGTVSNWRTASTTNIKMLQSMVTTRVDFKLYIYPCTTTYVHHWRGEISSEFSNPEALGVEDIITRKYREQFGCLPPANIQANPSQGESADIVDDG